MATKCYKWCIIEDVIIYTVNIVTRLSFKQVFIGKRLNYMFELTGYKDSKGNEYKVGDIVFNPTFGDYWVVQKYTEQEKKDFDAECDYCLVLNNDKDDYFEDIDVPQGFEIVMSSDNDDYELAISELNKLAQSRKDFIMEE